MFGALNVMELKNDPPPLCHYRALLALHANNTEEKKIEVFHKNLEYFSRLLEHQQGQLAKLEFN